MAQPRRVSRKHIPTGSNMHYVFVPRISAAEVKRCMPNHPTAAPFMAVWAKAPKEMHTPDALPPFLCTACFTSAELFSGNTSCRVVVFDLQDSTPDDVAEAFRGVMRNDNITKVFFGAQEEAHRLRGCFQAEEQETVESAGPGAPPGEPCACSNNVLDLQVLCEAFALKQFPPPTSSEPPSTTATAANVVRASGTQQLRTRIEDHLIDGPTFQDALALCNTVVVAQDEDGAAQQIAKSAHDAHVAMVRTAGDTATSSSSPGIRHRWTSQEAEKSCVDIVMAMLRACAHIHVSSSSCLLGPSALDLEPATASSLKPFVTATRRRILRAWAQKSDVRLLRFSSEGSITAVNTEDLLPLSGEGVARRPEDHRNNSPQNLLAPQSDISSIEGVVPAHIMSALHAKANHPPGRALGQILTEIVIEQGRPPRYAFGETYLDVFGDDNGAGGVSACTEAQVGVASQRRVTQQEIDAMCERIGKFGDDGRAGFDGQLHRISRMLNHRTGHIYALTIRVGRHIPSAAMMIQDLIRANKSILILGKAGTGKTTIIRSLAQFAADDLRRNVCIIDTSNEIAGDGDVPHPCIGRARRMMVQSLDSQHEAMVECVQNHTPHTMVIDEIGRPKEVNAARTVKQRGVTIMGSAHGSLETLLSNPELVGLLGGLKSELLGDEAARDAARTTNKNRLQSAIAIRDLAVDRLDLGMVMLATTSGHGSKPKKTVTSRASEPIFDTIVEVSGEDRGSWRVITDVAKAVDCALTRTPMLVERRTRVDAEVFFRSFEPLRLQVEER